MPSQCDCPNSGQTRIVALATYEISPAAAHISSNAKPVRAFEMAFFPPGRDASGFPKSTRQSMRSSPTPRVCFGLLCVFSILIAGCGSPSSQNLDSLTVTATPSTLSVGGASVLKAVAHLSDGTTQDVTAGTQWTLSNPALATMSSGALTAKAAGTLTVQAGYVEAAPAGSSPASASVA